MPQIFDVTASENARYKRNELEFWFSFRPWYFKNMFNIIGIFA